VKSTSYEAQVANRGDGLQVWRVAANILNKQSRTADKGWSSMCGVGSGFNNTIRIILLRNVSKGFYLEWIPWINDLS
jgi:hypothetical protein